MNLINDAFKICQEYGFPLTAQGMANCSFLLTEALENGIFFEYEDHDNAVSEAITLANAALQLLKEQNA